tara:strand:- start:258 stop:2822 length:2565 start_codon:yes stop_codon:yes gene_type:complete
MRFLKNWTIDLKKIPKYEGLKTIFSVPVDRKLCNLILQHDGKRKDGQPNIQPESIKVFKKMVDCMKADIMKVKYSPRYGYGRRYSDTPEEKYKDGTRNKYYGKYYGSLVSLPRNIKNTIFKYGKWKDFDQVKGHATILYELATKNGMMLTAYPRYLKAGGFQEVCEELTEYYGGGLTKSDIKWLFNKTIYGGGHKKWREDLKNGSYKLLEGQQIAISQPIIVKKEPHDFYVEFKKETREIIDLVYNNNQQLAEVVCKDIPDTEKNLWKRKNRVMSMFCGIIENEITYRAYKYAYENGMCEKNCIDWGYDGFTIPHAKEDYDLEKLNEYVRKQTKFEKISFIEKEFDEYLEEVIYERENAIDYSDDEEEDEEESEAELKAIEAEKEEDKKYCVLYDKEASDKIIKMLDGNIIKHNDIIYLKQGNIWIDDPDRVKQYVISFIMDSQLYTRNKDGNIVRSYKNFTKAMSVWNTLSITLGQDNTFDFNLFHSTTKKRLCFQNGVLCFRTKQFYKWDKVQFPYYSTQMINYDFQFVNDYHEIKTRVIEPLFCSDTDTALHYLGRSIAGCIDDKNFATYMGQRNTGKGVLFELLKGAFGDYVKPFNIQNIITNTNAKDFTQTSKDNYWIMDLEFCRLAVAQEIPDKKDIIIKSDVIKMLCSGGDLIPCRKNYDRSDKNVRPDFSMMIMGNEEIKSKSDTHQHRISLSGFTQFATKEQIQQLKEGGVSDAVLNKYRVADETIKDKCKTNEFHLKMVNLLFNEYDDNPLRVDLSKIDDDEEADNMGRFQEFFEITGNGKDIVDQKDVYEKCSKKIKSELTNQTFTGKDGEKIKVYHRRMKLKEFRDKNCFIGIRLREEVVEC